MLTSETADPCADGGRYRPHLSALPQAGRGLCRIGDDLRQGDSLRRPKTPELARLGEDEHPAALQIFGSDPSIMAEAAAWLCDNYAPDVIDINMGCPVRKIFTSGDGSALMRRPELAGRIVSAVRGAVSVPVTVKLRTGIDSGHINAPELARLLEASGADGLCIHGRTREQMYAPPVDLDTIAAVKSAVGIPVIGNGGDTLRGGCCAYDGANRGRFCRDRAGSMRKSVALCRDKGGDIR